MNFSRRWLDYNGQRRFAYDPLCPTCFDEPRSRLIGDPAQANDPPPSGTYAIIDDGNTQVLHHGRGVHTIEKISGAADTYDAAGVSVVGLSGDFVLRLSPQAGSTNYGAGMTSDPNADDSFASIDHLALYIPSGNEWAIYENAGAVAGGLVNNGYFWIWRTGTTLGYGRGATISAAQASPDRTVTDSATLYFDSSFTNVGGKMEALLSDPSTINIYTLTADTPPVFTLTGGNAGLNAIRKLTGTAGSFSMAGQSAGLRISRKLVLNVGSFALTGNSASLRAGRRLTANAGSFALTGQNATLSRQLRVSGVAASFAMTGQSASLRALRSLSMTAGSYSLSGQSASLVKAVQLTGQAGSYALTGQSATIKALRRLTGNVGSFAMSGQNASLFKAVQLVLQAGSYAMTGNDVRFVSDAGAGGGAPPKPKVSAFFYR